MLNGIAKYYLYIESKMDESGVPIQEPLRLYKAENAHRAAQACIGDKGGPWLDAAPRSMTLVKLMAGYPYPSV